MFEWLNDLINGASSMFGGDGTSGIGPVADGDVYASSLDGLTIPSIIGSASKGKDNSVLGDFIAAAAGPAISTIGASLLANNGASDAAQALAEKKREFDAELALKKEALAKGGGGGGGGSGAAMAALDLQRKLAKAKMIADAYQGLATNETVGRQNNANSLQGIINVIQGGARR